MAVVHAAGVLRQVARGRCPGCGSDRLLPGRSADGNPICRDCAGITRSFFCDRYGFEGRLHTGRLCERCTLADKATATLDDGTGRINPALPRRPRRSSPCPTRGQGGRGCAPPTSRTSSPAWPAATSPLTHQALHQLSNWRTVACLRDLLMACGVLPAVDKQFLHTETWLTHRLAELDGHTHEPLLRRFATWHLLPPCAPGPSLPGSMSAGSTYHGAGKLTWTLGTPPQVPTQGPRSVPDLRHEQPSHVPP
ncbi:hypothetical protein ACIBIZ_38195 [Nonomuraea spiralis]|uniref:hypothetical protein n=1 Tax=Nonomuraea spiralis TaxID=46182 RepID=UPI003791FC11